MKKITLFAALLLLLVSLQSFAQNAQEPSVTLKGLLAPQIKDGKQQPIFTTTDYISRNPVLVSSVPGAFEVTEFTAGISSSNQHLGPFDIKGNILTPAVIADIKKTRGPDVKVSIENIKAKMPDGSIKTLSPVTLKYDQ